MVQNCSAKQEINLIVQKTKVKQKRKHACRNQTKKKSTKMFIWLSVDKFAWFLFFPNLTV